MPKFVYKEHEYAVNTSTAFPIMLEICDGTVTSQNLLSPKLLSTQTKIL